MTPRQHACFTTTLASWLSVATIGLLGIFLPDSIIPPCPPPPSLPSLELLAPDINLNPTPTSPQESPTPSTTPAQASEVPTPPDLPNLAELPEIPEIPELPSLPTPPADLPPPATDSPSPHPTPTTHSTPKTTRSTKSSSNPTGKSSSSQSSSNPGSGSGTSSEASNASRIAAGKMPAPSYPAAAKRAGQSGTVVVAFTVDSSGSVISAQAVNPSQWPLLNEEAVKTVKRWKFPPGNIMKLQRPIVFKLR